MSEIEYVKDWTVIDGEAEFVALAGGTDLAFNRVSDVANLKVWSEETEEYRPVRWHIVEGQTVQRLIYDD